MRTFNPVKVSRRLAVAGAALALCLSAPLAQAQGAKVLKVGSILSLTGPNASIGKEGVVGLE